MTTTIAFVRHGQVENPENIIYGRLPRFRLSPTGLAEAKQAARLLQNNLFAALYTSPLLRARQTAGEIARFHPGLCLRHTVLLTEIRTPLQGRRKDAAAEGVEKEELFDQEEVEQPADILARTLRFLSRVRRHHRGGTVAAVTHGDLIYTLLLFARGATMDATVVQRYKKRGDIVYPATGSVTLISFETMNPNELPQCTLLDTGQTM